VTLPQRATLAIFQDPGVADGEEAGGGATVQDKLSSGRLAALALSTNPDTRVAHIFCPRKGEKA